MFADLPRRAGDAPDPDLVDAAVEVATTVVRTDAQRVGVGLNHEGRCTEKHFHPVDVEMSGAALVHSRNVIPFACLQPQPGCFSAVEAQLGSVESEHVPVATICLVLAHQTAQAAEAVGPEPALNGVVREQIQCIVIGDCHVVVRTVEIQGRAGTDLQRVVGQHQLPGLEHPRKGCGVRSGINGVSKSKW